MKYSSITILFQETESNSSWTQEFHNVGVTFTGNYLIINVMDEKNITGHVFDLKNIKSYKTVSE